MNLNVVRRGAFVAALSIICFSQSACSTLQAQSRVDPQTIAYYNPGKPDPLPPTATGAWQGKCPAKLADDTQGGAINLDCFRFPEDNDADADATAYRRAVGVKIQKTDGINSVSIGETDGTKLKTLRNRLGAILIKRADDICTLEMGRLVANEGIANTALTTLDSVFSTASTIVSGTQAKSILSGLSGVANTGRATLRAEVYRNALGPAIARAITNQRAKQLTGVQDRMKADDISDYTVDQMIVDINAYHQVCSFYRGIALVNDAVDAAKDQRTPLEATQSAISFYDEQIGKLREEKLRTGLAVSDQTALDARIVTMTSERDAMVKVRAGQLAGVVK